MKVTLTLTRTLTLNLTRTLTLTLTLTLTPTLTPTLTLTLTLTLAGYAGLPRGLQRRAGDVPPARWVEWRLHSWRFHRRLRSGSQADAGRQRSP